MSLFITGTDTGSGKTHVTSLLVESLRTLGIDAVGYKPVSCGDRDDGELLASISGNLSIDEVNPVFFRTPVAPYVASLLESKPIDPAILIEGYRKLAANHDFVCVEGVGGWEVPLTANYRISDLARDLDLPVLLVAANKLGALSHTLITTDAIRAKGLHCEGIILNQLVDELDTAMITNKGVLEDLTGLPILDHIIHGQDFFDPEIALSLAKQPAANS
ncbi:MAG: dethiobiotin synthase [Verrucomicrobiales bacterium]|nr:dethiobiotin synthase [Verrucomicrobiota bacterium JB025]